MRFVKGHGTGNDFVVLPDPDGELNAELTPTLVRALCDRRRGIGGDGVLRVVLAAAAGDAARDAPGARWFMDHRNADGSTAQMCGNGIRLFARYLVDAGYERPGSLRIGTRSGLRTVEVHGDGDVTVDMGPPELAAGPQPVVEVAIAGGDLRRFAGTAVSMGNPHVVCTVAGLADAGSLAAPPVVVRADGARESGQANVEFVVTEGASAVSMRVHERGVGETLSCGTGACAVAVAVAVRSGRGPGSTYDVRVPGGLLQVAWTPATVLLRGPAEVVATGAVDDAWLREAAGLLSPAH